MSAPARCTSAAAGCPTASRCSGGSPTESCAASRSRAPTPSSTAGGSSPVSSTRTATSASARTARSDSTRPSPRPKPSATPARCCCATAVRRSTPASLDDRPRPARDHQGRKASGAAQALRARTTPSNSRTSGSCPTAVAEQARRGDGWVKLVGDWIDRSVGDLAPLWSDDVLVAAVAAAHAEGARVTAHVFGEDALPGLINAGIDCIEHGTGLTEDTVALMAGARHRAGAHPDQHRELSRIRRCRNAIPGVRRAHARPLRPLPAADRRRAGGRVCRSTPAPTPAAPWRTD